MTVPLCTVLTFGYPSHRDLTEPEPGGGVARYSAAAAKRSMISATCFMCWMKSSRRMFSLGA